jgi:hypothetical protein
MLICENIIPLLALRVEWAKTRARKDRWLEEVLLVKEEMRWALVTWEHRAKIWDERTAVRMINSLSPELSEGIRAYAIQQARILRRRADAFNKLWSALTATSGSQHRSAKSSGGTSESFPSWLDQDDQDGDSTDSD